MERFYVDDRDDPVCDYSEAQDEIAELKNAIRAEVSNSSEQLRRMERTIPNETILRSCLYKIYNIVQ